MQQGSSRYRKPHYCVVGTPDDGGSEVLTVDEVAALLRVNRKTVYNVIADGDIPGVLRLGRALRISRRAVVEWLCQGRVLRSHGRRRP